VCVCVGGGHQQGQAADRATHTQQHGGACVGFFCVIFEGVAWDPRQLAGREAAFTCRRSYHRK
jgi:hypothetical protein